MTETTFIMYGIYFTRFVRWRPWLGDLWDGRKGRTWKVKDCYVECVHLPNIYTLVHYKFSTQKTFYSTNFISVRIPWAANN